jgi:hypothetical protein
MRVNLAATGVELQITEIAISMILVFVRIIR